MMSKKTVSRRIAKPYPRRCAECGHIAVEPATTSYDAEMKHDGKLHQFHVARLKIDRCRVCDEMFFTNSTDAQLTMQLRSVIGLLAPVEIRRQLSKLGITQREFAGHLRIAPETVSRWMTGLAIQNRALDSFMRIYFSFPVVRRALLAAPAQAKSKRNLSRSIGEDRQPVKAARVSSVASRSKP